MVVIFRIGSKSKALRRAFRLAEIASTTMKPNFFLIGAPKSGTTALSEYLRTHPEIFISPDKEPNFWNDDFRNLSTVRNFDEYEDLFRDAHSGHRAVGEASVHYLRSERAVPRILEKNPDARFIALLRNPVDLVYSWHSQALFKLDEDEADFEVAWSLQGARRRGERIPETCTDPKLLFYDEVAALGTHVAQLYANAPREQIQIHLFDDFKRDAGKVYRDTLHFLGVPDDGRQEFPVINENKSYRFKAVARFVERPPGWWVQGARALRGALGLQRIGLMRRLRDRNKVAQKRGELRAEFRKELTDFFRPEVDKLATIIERDLGDWFAPVSVSE